MKNDDYGRRERGAPPNAETVELLRRLSGDNDLARLVAGLLLAAAAADPAKAAGGLPGAEDDVREWAEHCLRNVGADEDEETVPSGRPDGGG